LIGLGAVADAVYIIFHMARVKENTLSLNLPAVTSNPTTQQASLLGNLSIEVSQTTPAKQRALSSSSVKEDAPKMKNVKSEILKIPKARQLLNMDKHIYMQDVEKRIELLGDLK